MAVSKGTSRFLQTGLALAVLSLAVLAVLFLGYRVVSDLDRLNSAHSDNVQWSLSQTEVEFLDFERQLIESANSAEPDLQNLRREFDLFYSRMNTIMQARLYAPLRRDERFQNSFNAMMQFLDQAVPLVDAPDPVLTEKLQELRQMTAMYRSQVRGMSVSGLSHFAFEADRYRQELSVTLIRLAVVLSVLIVTLALSAIYLARLNGINSRRRREIALAGERTRTIIQTALDAVIVADAQGQVQTFNPAAEQIFGCEASAAMGRPITDFMTLDTGGLSDLNGQGQVQLLARRANGESFPAEITVQSAGTETGEICIAFLRDISRRVEAEAELVAARDQALAGEKAKTVFLTTMSHEIRTPLNGLLGNLSLLQGTKLTEEQTRHVVNMDTSGRLLMSHVSDVLDISKYDADGISQNMGPTDLERLLQEIVDSQVGAAAARNTRLDWRWAGPVQAWVRTDQDKLQHILMNLVGNAVKFTENGRVTIEIECDPTVGTEMTLSLRVIDTGSGIAEEEQHRIFDDFVTGVSMDERRAPGTGLGLSIANRFVTALGGEIGVESDIGQGSVFWVNLPVVAVDRPVPPTSPRLQNAAVRELNILLVEDNEINRQVAREMLVQGGHKVSEAANGQIGVDMAATQSFDVILMDISMPVMDGRAATRRIRGAEGPNRTTPIIALTAHALADERLRFLQDGMEDVLIKPLNRAALEQVLMETERAAEDVEDNIHDLLGPQVYARLMRGFSAEMDELLCWLDETASADVEETIRRCHQVAGSAALFSQWSVRDDLLAVQAAARSRNRDALRRAIIVLGQGWKDGTAAGSETG